MNALYKRITNFSLAAIIAVSGLSALTPVLFATSANAAPGLVYQTSPSITDLDYVTDRQAPSGGYDFVGGALNLRIDNNNASANPGFNRTEGVQAAIDTTTSIEATLTVGSNWYDSESDTLKPVRAGLWAVAGSNTASDVAWPTIEFTTIGEEGFVGWRVFDTMNGGWTNLEDVPYAFGASYAVEIAFNAATKTYDYYVAGVRVLSQDAFYEDDVYGNLQAVIFNNFNSATANASDNYTVTWNNFKTGAAPVTTSCVDPASVVTTDLSTWDTARTRANGHNVIVDGGLHIYTDTDVTGSPDPRKAAGYFATNFALSGLGSQTIAESMDYTNTSETSAPGLQLLVDFDNDASNNTVVLANGQSGDGFLVGEAVYEGNSWWLSEGNNVAKNGAPYHATSVYNTAWYGTPNEWLAQFPAARVNAIGYSLGSGANGDGIITRISLGCVDYTFDLPVVVTPPAGQPTGGPAGDTNGDDSDGTTDNGTTGGITTPAITGVASILGATDTSNQGNSDVAGATDDKTAAVDTDVSDGSIFGLAWYWWILILALIAGLVWWIIGAIRRRNADA